MHVALSFLRLRRHGHHRAAPKHGAMTMRNSTAHRVSASAGGCIIPAVHVAALHHNQARYMPSVMDAGRVAAIAGAS
jgi:hypothetical protein